MVRPESGWRASGVRPRAGSPLVHALWPRNIMPMVVATSIVASAANHKNLVRTRSHNQRGRPFISGRWHKAIRLLCIHPEMNAQIGPCDRVPLPDKAQQVGVVAGLVCHTSEYEMRVSPTAFAIRGVRAVSSPV